MKSTTSPNNSTRAARQHPQLTSLEEWVEWLKNEYGLHAAIGNIDRWSTPPVRNELAALRTASGALTQTKPGSFEAAYWHDALDRVVERIPRHYSRWAKNNENQTMTARANQRLSPAQP